VLELAWIFGFHRRVVAEDRELRPALREPEWRHPSQLRRISNGPPIRVGRSLDQAAVGVFGPASEEPVAMLAQRYGRESGPAQLESTSASTPCEVDDRAIRPASDSDRRAVACRGRSAHHAPMAPGPRPHRLYLMPYELPDDPFERYRLVRIDDVALARLTRRGRPGEPQPSTRVNRPLRPDSKPAR